MRVGDEATHCHPPRLPITLNSISPAYPFYLDTGDRPDDFVTPTHLQHDNYDEWATDIQLDLEARRKLFFLDGTIFSTEPPYSSADWAKVNTMLVSWISNTIYSNVKGTSTKFREAKRLWDRSKTRFATVNGSRIQLLRSVIARFEQSKSMFVSAYYGKLNAF